MTLLVLFFWLALATAHATGEDSVRILGSTDHVLVIGRPFFARTVADILEAKGCTVDVAGAGTAAKLILTQKPTLLILEDGIVPDAEVRKVRKQSSGALVLMTGDTLRSKIDGRVKSTGANAVLGIPFSSEDVLEAVWRAMNPGRKSPAELERAAEEHRKAQIAGMSSEAVLQVQPPLSSEREAFKVLVDRIVAKAKPKDFEIDRLASWELDLLLIDTLWTVGLATYTDTALGDGWELAAKALERAGLNAEASALRASYAVLKRRGPVDDAEQRSRSRSELSDKEREQWESLARIVEESAWQSELTKKVLKRAYRSTTEPRAAPGGGG